MSDWTFRDDYFPRWQLSDADGMMLGIVERPVIELPGDHPVHIPLGWTWRNSFAGPGRWCMTRAAAMQAAEVGAAIAASLPVLDYSEDDDE